MPILFSAVAYEQCVLAKFASCEGNFMEIVEEVMSKIPPKDDKMTYSHGHYLFHYVAENQHLYFCVTAKSCQRSRAFLFLNEIKRRFTADDTKRFWHVLAAEMQRYSEDYNTITIRKGELDELNAIGVGSSESILGEKLLLVNNPENLTFCTISHVVGETPQQIWLSENTRDSIALEENMLTARISKAVVQEENNTARANRGLVQEEDITTKGVSKVLVKENNTTTMRANMALVKEENNTTTRANRGLVEEVNITTEGGSRALVQEENNTTMRANLASVKEENNTTTTRANRGLVEEDITTEEVSKALAQEENNTTMRANMASVKEENNTMTTRANRGLVKEENITTEGVSRALVKEENITTTRDSRGLVQEDDNTKTTKASRAIVKEENTRNSKFHFVIMSGILVFLWLAISTFGATSFVIIACIIILSLVPLSKKKNNI